MMLYHCVQSFVSMAVKLLFIGLYQNDYVIFSCISSVLFMFIYIFLGAVYLDTVKSV